MLRLDSPLGLRGQEGCAFDSSQVGRHGQRSSLMLLRSFRRFVEGLRGKGGATPRRPRYRLCLEPLEGRVVPASFTWSGGTTTAYSDANWTSGANWQGG